MLRCCKFLNSRIRRYHSIWPPPSVWPPPCFHETDSAGSGGGPNFPQIDVNFPPRGCFSPNWRQFSSSRVLFPLWPKFSPNWRQFPSKLTSIFPLEDAFPPLTKIFPKLTSISLQIDVNFPLDGAFPPLVQIFPKLTSIFLLRVQANDFYISKGKMRAILRRRRKFLGVKIAFLKGKWEQFCAAGEKFWRWKWWQFCAAGKNFLRVFSDPSKFLADPPSVSWIWGKKGGGQLEWYLLIQSCFVFGDFSMTTEPISIIFGLWERGTEALHPSFKILRIGRTLLKIENKTCSKPTITISVVIVGLLHVLFSIFKECSSDS